MSRPWVWAIAAALLAGLFAYWRAHVPDPATTALENRLIDLRFALRGRVEPPGNVVLVGVDAATVDALGWSPPPRAEIAQVITKLTEAGATAVALDMLFLDGSDEDAALAQALAASEQAILAAAARYDGRPGGGRLEARDALSRHTIAVVIGAPTAVGAVPRFYLPNAELINTAALAHVNLSQSSDRVARYAPLAIWTGEEGHLAAMAVTSARLHLGVPRSGLRLEPGRQLTLGERVLQTDRRGRIPINHYGPEATIPTVSFLEVLNGDVPTTMFADRVAVIGVTDQSFSDVFATPFGANVPGAEVIATLAENLISEHTLKSAGSASTVGLVLAPFVALALAAAAYLSLTAISVGVIWVIVLAVVQLAFQQGALLLDATTLVGALLIGSFAALRIRTIRNGARRAVLERERGNLSRYVAPALAEQLAAQGGPGFDRRDQDAAVLFADVEGYTTIAERLTPAEAAAFVRTLHRTFEHSVERHMGVIISFEGDGVMVGFGLPQPAADDAVRALHCGRTMIEDVAQLEAPGQPGTHLRLRVGINHGPVVAAVVGGDRQAHVTLSGDTVNVASRLQDIAKSHGVQFVASKAALDAAEASSGEMQQGWALLIRTALRGRTEEIEAWTSDPVPNEA